MNESMSLAGINPVQGGAVFITQYTSPCVFSGSRVGYAVSNDIITKNICTLDKNKTLSMQNYEDTFKNKKLKVFKYIGNKSANDILSEITSNLGNEVDNNYLYETITGKKLLSDDQLEYDELLEEINPKLLQNKLRSDLKTLNDGYKDSKGRLYDIPIMNEADILDAAKLTDNSNIYFYEAINGYYAENSITRKRTGIYKAIKDIPIEIIL